MSDITWSPESIAFFDALDGTRNIFIRAVAGSGKTTNLVEACRRVPQPCRVVLLAFNKNIADALEPRIPYYATASTFHSYCLSALRRIGWAKGKPNGRKCAAILARLVPNWKDRREWQDDALTLVSRAKSVGWGYLCPEPEGRDAQAILRELTDKFGLQLDDSHLLKVEQILAESQANKATVDFDDMLLFALDPAVSFDHCNFLFVDEAQDTNSVQRALLRKMVGRETFGIRPEENRPGCRLVCVGDPSQSIYGFRGADADACAALVRDFDMLELPLSVTHRCSQAVTAEARKYEFSFAVEAQNGPQPKPRSVAEQLQD